ncbi:MAG: carboxypeptidase-like regulatory domain-containing protein, partial [Bacteroidota bacterium]
MNDKGTVIRFLLILLVSLYIPGQVFAGNTGKISGRITDAATGEAIPGINIIIEKTSLGAASDFEGYFTINNIPPGSYDVTVSGIGYQKRKYVSVKVSADFTVKLDVQMTVEAISKNEVVVIAEAPMVRKDLTSSQASVDASQIETLP